MSRKWLAVLTLAVALAAPTVADATPTVTGHTGYVDSTYLAIAGAGFLTTPPSVAYMWDFEQPMPEGGTIRRPSMTLGRGYPPLSYGTVNTNRFFMDAYDSTGLVGEPFAVYSGDYAKRGSKSLKVRASEYNAYSDSLGAVIQYVAGAGAGLESIFLSTWFKIVATDTTIAGSGAGDEKLLRFSLIRFLAQNSANNVDVIKVINHNDSLRTCVGVGTWKTWDQAGSSTDHFNDIADGAWHKLEAFVKSEGTPASSRDGKMMIYLDDALCDSTNSIDWPNNTQGWYGVALCPVVTEDPGRKLTVYFDDLYIAGGHATTVDNRAASRVEFYDKMWYCNSTESYVQFPVSWADGAITVYQTGLFDATDKVYVKVFTTGGDLLEDNADGACLDSLQSAVPVLGSATASSAYLNFPAETQTFTWTNSSDNGLVGRDSKSSTTIVDWGDGETSTLTTPGDTTSTHSYAAAGTYTVTLRVTNPAGTTTGTTSYIVYNYPDEDYPFPVSGIDMKSALYDVKDSSGYRARWWRVYAPTREVEFNLYDCTGGTCTLVWPLASTFVSADDTIRTVYRGTSIDIDLGDYRANTFHYRTPLTADDDSTAVHIGWR